MRSSRGAYAAAQREICFPGDAEFSKPQSDKPDLHHGEKRLPKSWVAASVRASLAPGRALQISAAGIDLLRENVRSDPGAEWHFAVSFGMFAIRTAGVSDFGLSAAMIGDLEGILLAHPDEPPVRDVWRKRSGFSISRLLPTDPAGCRRLLDSLERCMPLILTSRNCASNGSVCAAVCPRPRRLGLG